jgi:hypothetical protein
MFNRSPNSSIIKGKRKTTRNESLVISLALLRHTSSVIYTRSSHLHAVIAPKITSLPAAKATPADVFRDWALVPSNPRMLCRSLQGDTFPRICKSITQENKEGCPLEYIWHQNSDISKSYEDTIYLKRKGTFAEKPLEQISKLGVHVIRYLHRIIGYLFGGND